MGSGGSSGDSRQLIGFRAFKQGGLLRNLSTRHCAVLEVALDTLKECFNPGNGLKDRFLDGSAELQSLRHALALYSQSTDGLIRRFVSTQTEQGNGRAPGRRIAKASSSSPSSFLLPNLTRFAFVLVQTF